MHERERPSHHPERGPGAGRRHRAGRDEYTGASEATIRRDIRARSPRRALAQSARRAEESIGGSSRRRGSFGKTAVRCPVK